MWLCHCLFSKAAFASPIFKFAEMSLGVLDQNPRNLHGKPRGVRLFEFIAKLSLSILFTVHIRFTCELIFYKLNQSDSEFIL